MKIRRYSCSTIPIAAIRRTRSIETDRFAARIVPGELAFLGFINMNFFSRLVLVIVCLFVCSLRFCSTSSDTTAKEKQFVPFSNATSRDESRDVKEGSFINVPINCPKGRVMIGDRCRATF